METENEKKQPEVVEYINDFPSKEKENQFELEQKQAEENFQASQEKAVRKKKFFKMFRIAFVLLVIVGVGIFAYLRNKNQQAGLNQQKVQVEIPKNQDHVFVNDVSGVNAVVEDVKIASEDLKGIAAKSENYRIRDIAIGGANMVLAAETEKIPLKVSDVRSETLMSKDGKKTQLLISWKTNKLAKSEVGYSKDGNGVERNVKEDGYGFSHALVLNSLEQSTRYLFAVTANDRSGNSVTSDSLAVYTGTKPVSVIELISSQMGEIFGWALKK